MVRTTFKKIVYPCWRPSCVEGDDEDGGRVDGLWWYKDSGKHANGEFSMALIQANSVLEDQCQLESGCLSSVECGPQGTFVGIYDGHAGPEAARFINHQLFNNLKRYASESQGMSAETIRKAFLATEEEFLSLVESQWLSNPKLASVGSCCLVGIICNGVLYIANAGDSLAVLAREEKAVRLSDEHNAKFEAVREELRSLHPDDSNIVALKHNVWRVKGLIQGSRPSSCSVGVVIVLWIGLLVVALGSKPPWATVYLISVSHDAPGTRRCGSALWLLEYNHFCLFCE